MPEESKACATQDRRPNPPAQEDPVAVPSIPDGCFAEMSTEEIARQITLWRDLASHDSHPGIRALAFAQLVKCRGELWRRDLADLETSPRPEKL
jgi:hypothetical protein